MSNSNTNQKKLLKVELEPDEWFEIADHLRDRLTDMQSLINGKSSYYREEPEFQRRYIYLKTIVEKLEYELTH